MFVDEDLFCCGSTVAADSSGRRKMCRRWSTERTPFESKQVTGLMAADLDRNLEMNMIKGRSRL